MVYISSDGSVCQTQPWGFDKIVGLFYGLITFIVFFFKTLVGLDPSKSITGSRFGGSGSSSRGGGSGGGGPGSGPGSGGGGGPSKRLFTMRDINPPTIGGCPGGSCGM